VKAALALAAVFFLVIQAAHGEPAKKKKAPSASTGSSAPSSAVLRAEQDKAFRALDLDGDGKISIAEAAGNAPLVTRFDRADRNRDGKLDRKEYDRLVARMKKK